MLSSLSIESHLGCPIKEELLNRLSSAPIRFFNTSQSLIILMAALLCPFVQAFDTRVRSASEVRSSGGKYCTQKTMVDIHAHAGCLSDGGKTCFVSERMRRERVAGGLISKYKSMFGAFGVDEATLKAKGNPYFFRHVSQFVAASTCVDSVVLLALDGTYNYDGASFLPEKTDFMITNDFVSQEVRKYPNLLWGASVHPFRKDFREELQKAHQNGAVLVKLIPPIQAVPLESESGLVRQRMQEFYKLLAHYKLPLLVHLDEEGTFSKSLEREFRQYVGVLGIRAAIEAGVTVIVAHAASRESKVDFRPGYRGNTYQDFLLLMDEPSYRGRLFADISALPTIVTRQDHLCRVLRDLQGQEDRLLWGSDYPLNNWKTTSTVLIGPGCGRGTFSPSSDERYALNMNRHQWDRAIFLQKNMGASEKIFNNTRHFLLQRRLVEVSSDGRLQIQKRR